MRVAVSAHEWPARNALTLHQQTTSKFAKKTPSSCFGMGHLACLFQTELAQF